MRTRPRRIQRSWYHDETQLTLLIMWLAIGALAIGLWACWEQYRTITIPALAEDDCPFYHGAYPLDEVKPDGDGHVWCIYRSAF